MRAGDRSWRRRPRVAVVVIALVALLLALSIARPGPVTTLVPHSSLLASTDRTDAYRPGWTNVSGASGEGETPPARSDAGSTYDALHTAWILFGGVDATGALLNETWLFIVGEDSWTSLAVFANSTAPPSPPPLRSPALAFDAADGSVLLFGGMLADGTAYGGTWILSGANWTDLRWTPLTSAGGPAPAASTSPGLAYDESSQAVVLYDGGAPNSTWSFRAGAWTAVHAPTEPPARTHAAFVYDPELGGIVLFGGVANGPSYVFQNDTWLLRESAWERLATNRSPPAVGEPLAAYDRVDGYLIVLLAGFDATEQTWTLAGSVWTNVTDAGPRLPARDGAAVLGDLVDRVVLVYGGSLLPSGQVVDELWAWNLPTPPEDTRLLVSMISTQTIAAVGLLGIVPAVLLWLYYRRPPSRVPVDVPAPVPHPA
jgi:hypothetical protein